jgi:hypothetical protein
LLKNRDQVVRNKDVNDFVLGYNIGIGLQPKSILSGKLFVELKYGSSFSNLIESDYLEVKFNKLQFNIGCYIN